ncbi:hypothetical protein [Dyadobacter sp.]|uniref:hypothetical protein n=1 Tax=Dyadobacter sp. TaxID=1914288 RepID=UPI003F7088F6
MRKALVEEISWCEFVVPPLKNSASVAQVPVRSDNASMPRFSGDPSTVSSATKWYEKEIIYLVGGNPI